MRVQYGAILADLGLGSNHYPFNLIFACGNPKLPIGTHYSKQQEELLLAENMDKPYHETPGTVHSTVCFERLAWRISGIQKLLKELSNRSWI